MTTNHELSAVVTVLDTLSGETVCAADDATLQKFAALCHHWSQLTSARVGAARADQVRLPMTAHLELFQKITVTCQGYDLRSVVPACADALAMSAAIAAESIAEADNILDDCSERMKLSICHNWDHSRRIRDDLPTRQ
jgi:hypothetical protein